jgi:hypothetical protein
VASCSVSCAWAVARVSLGGFFLHGFLFTGVAQDSVKSARQSENRRFQAPDHAARVVVIIAVWRRLYEEVNAANHVLFASHRR